MGNLILETGSLNMSKALVSVWFRITSDAAAAVQARDPVPLSEDVNVMDHVVPILMWGTQQTTTIWDTLTPTASCGPYTVGMSTFGPFTDTLSYVSGSHECPAQQSCIGVQCLPAQTPTLYIHLQPGHGATCVNTRLDLGPSYSCSFPAAEVSPGSGAIVVTPATSDASYVDGGIEEAAVGNSDSGNHGPFGGQPEITLDGWHHLLIWWNLGDESATSATVTQIGANQPASDRITTTSKMFCALDGVNKNGDDLPATWVGFDGLGTPDPNTIACSQIIHISGLSYDPAHQSQYTGAFDTASTAAMSHGSIPSSSLWITGADSILTQSRSTIFGNQNIDAAELQIFCDVAEFDTSNLTNRQAFIKDDGTPETDYSFAEDILGAAPKVRLHGSTGWKAGVNTGSLGGVLTKSGTINTSGSNPDITP